MKKCSPGKSLNKNTGRCRNSCPLGQIRKSNGKCANVKRTPPVVKPVRLSWLPNEFDKEIVCEDDDDRCSLDNILKDEDASYVYYNGKGCAHYKKGDRMGKPSRYGTVYYTCCGLNNCNHVTKIVKFGNTNTTEMFHEEIMLQQMAAKEKIAPPISNAYISSKHGIVVMKKMDETMLDHLTVFLQTNPSRSKITLKAKKFATAFCELVMKLHSIGILHGDLHVDNIMFKSNKMYLIDFGKARLKKITRGHRLNYEYRQLDDYTSWKYLASSIHKNHKNTGITDANIKLFYDVYFDTIRSKKEKEEEKYM